jgi:myo-inositol-1(or 4)-monophosphatase
MALKALRRAFPGHSVLGEETGAHGAGDVNQAEFLWVVDPLDGTVNYSHGLPNYSISIGLRHRGQALLGVVHAPSLRETYLAEAGKGALLNGSPIHVSRITVPKSAVFVSGFSYNSFQTGQNLPEWMVFMRQFQALRRTGCASLDYSWVACGRFEGFWEYGLKPWDSAAGELLVREAGGKVSGVAGEPLDIFQEGVLATNGLLHARCLSALRRARRVRLAWPPKGA